MIGSEKGNFKWLIEGTSLKHETAEWTSAGIKP
jgi:hypothetical protein